MMMCRVKGLFRWKKECLFLILMGTFLIGKVSAQKDFSTVSNKFTGNVLPAVNDLSLHPYPDFQFSPFEILLNHFSKNYYDFRKQHYSKGDSIRSMNNAGVILALKGRLDG